MVSAGTVEATGWGNIWPATELDGFIEGQLTAQTR